MRAIFSLAVVLVGTAAQAQASEPRAFVCKFSQGTSGTYEARWSSKTTSDTLDFTFASFDPQNGRAEFIGDVGAVSVRYWKGAWTWNFVELTDVGALVTTTVFGSVDGHNIPAVHSRHTSVLEAAVPSHYRGVCTVRT